VGADIDRAQGDAEHGRGSADGDAGAGDQRFQQHVTGAELEAGAAAFWMNAGECEPTPGFHLAGHSRVIRGTLRAQREQGGPGVLGITLLDRALGILESHEIHGIVLLVGSWSSRCRDRSWPSRGPSGFDDTDVPLPGANRLWSQSSSRQIRMPDVISAMSV